MSNKLKLPAIETRTGLILALLLKRKEVSPHPKLFSQSVLQADIHALCVKYSFNGSINYRQDKSAQPGADRVYWLDLDVVDAMDEHGQTWADATLRYHGVGANDFESLDDARWWV